MNSSNHAQEERRRTWPRTTLLAAPLIAGAGAGLLAAAVGATVFERTSTDDFCLSCHEMQPFADEAAETSHDINRSGVRAGCADCHLPKDDWVDYAVAKTRAGAADVWAHFVLGQNTPEKLLARREALADAVWAEMRASDSRACRNCHGFAAMDLDAQNPTAAVVHAQIEANGRTCIDCHKGLAHALPGRERD